MTAVAQTFSMSKDNQQPDEETRFDRRERPAISRSQLTSVSIVVGIAIGCFGAVKSMVLTPYRLGQIEKDHAALVLKTTAENVSLQTKIDPMRDTLIRIEVELGDIKRLLPRANQPQQQP